MAMSDKRPNSYQEFVDLARSAQQIQLCCLSCGATFTPENVHTAAGWRETQISGMCEDCFDELFAEPETEGDDGDGPAV